MLPRKGMGNWQDFYWNMERALKRLIRTDGWLEKQPLGRDTTR